VYNFDEWINVVGAALGHRLAAESNSSASTSGRSVMDSKQLSTHQSVFFPKKVGTLFILFCQTSPHFQIQRFTGASWRRTAEAERV